MLSIPDIDALGKPTVSYWGEPFLTGLFYRGGTVVKHNIANKQIIAKPLRYNRLLLSTAFISAMLLLLLVTACSPDQPAISTSDLTPTSRASSTNSPTASPTVRPPYTPRPTKTPRPTITRRATQISAQTTPAATPTVTPLPIFNLLAGDANPSHYQLATPEPVNISHIINQEYEQKMDSTYSEASDKAYRQALYDDAVALFRAATFELQVHYPQGLPDPQLAFLIHGDHYVWSDEYAWFMPILQAGIFDLLRDQELSDQQIINIEATEIKIFQAELDGDPGVEWLAVANMSQYALLTWLRIDTLPDGTYQLMPYNPDMFNFAAYLFDPTLVEEVGDYNHDGLTDMLLNAPFYMGGRVYYRFYFVQGSAADFEVISEIEANAFVTDGHFGYTVLQPPETDQLMLTITDPVDLNWGCRYDTITTYEWSTGDLQTTQQGTEPPLTAECYLAQAVTLRKPLNPDTDISLLQQALALFTEDDPEDIPKIAFAHYRLAVLYALRHDDTQARAHLQAFLDFNRQTGSEQVETADAEVAGLLTAPRLEPLALCSWIAGTPYTYFPDWSIYTNETASRHAYPLSNEISPWALCPVSQVTDWILESITVVPGVSPASALVSAGLPVVTAQSLRLPGWEEPAWLVLLQSDPYDLVSYRPWEAENRWKEEDWFSPSSGEATWLNQDVTGDGYPEIAFAVPLLDPFGAHTGTYQVSITSMVTDGIVVETSAYPNVPDGELFDLVSFLADHDGDGVSDAFIAEVEQQYHTLPPLEPVYPPIWPTDSQWSRLLDTALEAQAVIEAEPESLTALFEGADPAETRAALTQILDDLQGADPSTLLYRQRLMYLVGLSYELEGQADLAVATYIQVILANPDSLWSALAACNLSPAE
jgi:hypothetical protein